MKVCSKAWNKAEKEESPRETAKPLLADGVESANIKVHTVLSDEEPGTITPSNSWLEKRE
ncbi:MAG: hypothetical protein HamCj_20460 [Candidatus Hamiltonella defensa (Ceratovacuna japonica)]